VRYLDTNMTPQEVSADVVVLAGGAFESPRLLLRCGVGNSSGLVGRYLMFHFQTLVVASFPFRLHAHKGRAVTHLHDDHMIPDDDSRAFAREHDLPYFRAGIVEHGGAGFPILESVHLPPGEWHSKLMLESPMRDRLLAFTVQGEDVPQITNRIDLDPKIKDVYGEAAGRATYNLHPHELVASKYYAPKLEEVMRAAGAEWTIVAHSPPIEGEGAAGALGEASASKHIMGTLRMGTDPTTSVVDPMQRLWDVPNVVCTDSSVFPTSTGYGPTLTLVALAIRACRDLANLPPLRSDRSSTA
jgi:choline dehydrogenase-like flavoprotein